MELSEEQLDIMDLAFLFKIPLYKLLDEMTYEEFIAWGVYLKKRPPGRAEDYRAALLISAFAPKAPISKLFPSLVPEEKSTLAGKLEGSAMLQYLLSAKGGQKLEL